MKEQRFSTDENPDGLDPARGMLNGSLLGVACWILIAVITYCLVGC